MLVLSSSNWGHICWWLLVCHDTVMTLEGAMTTSANARESVLSEPKGCGWFLEGFYRCHGIKRMNMGQVLPGIKNQKPGTTVFSLWTVWTIYWVPNFHPYLHENYQKKTCGNDVDLSRMNQAIMNFSQALIHWFQAIRYLRQGHLFFCVLPRHHRGGQRQNETSDHKFLWNLVWIPWEILVKSNLKLIGFSCVFHSSTTKPNNGPTFMQTSTHICWDPHKTMLVAHIHTRIHTHQIYPIVYLTWSLPLSKWWFLKFWGSPSHHGRFNMFKELTGPMTAWVGATMDWKQERARQVP